MVVEKVVLVYCCVSGKDHGPWFAESSEVLVLGSIEPRCPTKTFGRDCKASHGNEVTTLSFTFSGLASLLFHTLFATAMSAQNTTSEEDVSSAPMEMGYRELPFPPVTKQHILNCSYHNWHPKSVVSRTKIPCAL